MPPVSVIIPVYNAESWLNRCVDSVLGQHFKQLEIILIDDGSTDRSGEICDRYAAGDSRIKVFHKPNEGISATRQFGLDHAGGDYVVFLDADDYIEASMYGSLYHLAETKDADLVISDWYSVQGNKLYSDRFHFSSWCAIGVLEGFVKDQPGFLWPIMIRRSLFTRLHLRLDLSRQAICEDRIILISLLSGAWKEGMQLKVEHLREPVYYYDKTANPASLMKKAPATLNEQRVRSWTIIKDLIDPTLLGRQQAFRLTEYAFMAIWNRLFDDSAFQALYAPHKGYIEQYAPFSSRRFLTLVALEKGIDAARNYKWLAIPLILREKILLYFRELRSMRMA